MTPETKGQPEPVACPGPVLYRVMGRDPDGEDELELISFEPFYEHADLCAEEASRAGWKDLQIRPLYDYDVPALLESREKLVEALEDMAGRSCGIPGHSVAVGCGCPEQAREALAAAREES